MHGRLAGRAVGRWVHGRLAGGAVGRARLAGMGGRQAAGQTTPALFSSVQPMSVASTAGVHAHTHALALLCWKQAENDHHIKDTYNYVTVQARRGCGWRLQADAPRCCGRGLRRSATLLSCAASIGTAQTDMRMPFLLEVVLKSARLSWPQHADRHPHAQAPPAAAGGRLFQCCVAGGHRGSGAGVWQGSRRARVERSLCCAAAAVAACRCSYVHSFGG